MSGHEDALIAVPARHLSKIEDFSARARALEKFAWQLIQETERLAAIARREVLETKNDQ